SEFSSLEPRHRRLPYRRIWGDWDLDNPRLRRRKLAPAPTFRFNPVARPRYGRSVRGRCEGHADGKSHLDIAPPRSRQRTTLATPKVASTSHSRTTGRSAAYRSIDRTLLGTLRSEDSALRADDRFRRYSDPRRHRRGCLKSG